MERKRRKFFSFPNGWPTVDCLWVLRCYAANGSVQEYTAKSQQNIYERMCSHTFIRAMRKRGFTSWEMRQEAPRVQI